MQLRLRIEAKSHSDIGERLREPGDAALIVRGVPRLLVLKCPCGCGEHVVINLDKRAGKAWSFYRRRGKISIFPSIWQELGCRCHFIIWANQIFVIGDSADEGEQSSFDEPGLYVRIRHCVLAHLTREDFVHFEHIAEQCEEVPWDVLRACRKMATERILEEGRGQERGKFRLSD